MKKFAFYLSTILLISLSACNRSEKNWVVAEKIQYDVNIVSPDPSYDWWIQNLVGPNRDRLTDLLIEAPLKGNVLAYDYFNKALSIQKINEILVDTSYIMLTQDYPPYEEFDTMVIKRIDAKDIIKIRFLEEWSMDTVSLQMKKKVIGIGPIIKSFGNNGEFRGYQPLYWIYTDQDFLKILNPSK